MFGQPHEYIWANRFNGQHAKMKKKQFRAHTNTRHRHINNINQSKVTAKKSLESAFSRFVRRK